MLKRVKDKVLHCLEHYPATRDSDKVLINAVIVTFHKNKLDSNGRIALVDLYNLPSMESIRRSRQIIQNNEKKFLPTKADVFKKRGWQEEEYRKFVGANPELRKIY